MAEGTSNSEWTSVEKATAYLERAGSIPHSAEGERVLLDLSLKTQPASSTSVPATVVFSRS